MLVAAATIVALAIGLLVVAEVEEFDSVRTDTVPPSQPVVATSPMIPVPTTVVVPTQPVVSTSPTTTVPTTVVVLTEPATGAGADGLVIVAANPHGDRGGRHGDLYLLMSGEVPRMIQGRPGDEVAQQCPQLSTDARFIAWGEGTGTRDSNQRGVWPVVDRDVVVAQITDTGTVLVPIIDVPIPDGDGETICPKWAPDGSAVAYRVNGDVWITRTVDGTTTVVDAAETPWSMAEVAWSNDSSRVAASEGGQVRVIDVATGASYQMDTGDSVPRHLAWLPGDQQILFATTDPLDNTEDILVASVNGTGGGGESILGSLPSPGAGGSHAFGSPALSADGSRVAVAHAILTCESGGCSSGPSEVLVIDLATSTIATLAEPDERLLSTVTWSPDGRRLLLSSIAGVITIPVDADGPAVTLATATDLNLEWFHDEITWQVPAAATAASPPTSIATSRVAPDIQTVHLTLQPANIPVTFSAPADWTWTTYNQDSESPKRDVGLRVDEISNVYGEGCRWIPLDPPVGPTVDDLAQAWVKLPQYAATAPVDVTVDGYVGKQVEFTVPTYRVTLCNGADTLEFLLWYSEPHTLIRLNAFGADAPNEHIKQLIVDVDGTRLVITAYFLPSSSAQNRADLDQALASIRIG